MKSLKLHAPAKVNIILRVLGRRPNGYHDLFMVMEKLSLADDILLEEILSGIELTVEGETDSGMIAEKNLAYRAAQAFREATAEKRGVRIHLTKNIPVAAGLGGGSSDAASVLIGLNHLWEKNWDSSKLAKLGVSIGGDVPFFCYDGPAVVQGIGDRIEKISNLPKLHFLLVNPGFAVSTQWVYQEYDKRMSVSESLELTLQNKDASNGALTLQNFKGGLFKGFCDVVASLKNDLENVTISRYPEIQEIKDFLLNNGAGGALMSGSGPTVFGLFEKAGDRDLALAAVTRKNWKAFAADNFSKS